MELLEGQLLADVVAAEGRLAPERFLPILAQVCDGIAAVHAAGFVHRDLKPENIYLVAREGRRDVVKLLDFGLVKALRADVALPTATLEGTFMGSPAYTSPEQAQGQPVDHRTDIYAIGIMVHELVTGQLPFQADRIADLLMKHITVEAPRLPAEMLETDVGLCAGRDHPDVPREGSGGAVADGGAARGHVPAARGRGADRARADSRAAAAGWGCGRGAAFDHVRASRGAGGGGARADRDRNALRRGAVRATAGDACLSRGDRAACRRGRDRRGERGWRRR